MCWLQYVSQCDDSVQLLCLELGGNESRFSLTRRVHRFQFERENKGEARFDAADRYRHHGVEKAAIASRIG